MTSGEEMKTFNLKLPEGTRSKFKTVTKNRHTTMQAVLAAFTESFIETPDKFVIKMEVVESGS